LGLRVGASPIRLTARKNTSNRPIAIGESAKYPSHSENLIQVRRLGLTVRKMRYLFAAISTAGQPPPSAL
jgi:hypothetical protein